MNPIFERIGAARVGRSMFDLSYEKKFTCDMGQLIPIMCDEVVPGDVFSIANQIVARFMPLVSPMLHEVWAIVHYYFVPYRILFPDWEKFITGGEDGQDATVIPTWNPTNTAVGSLWDYLGFPTGIVPTGALPLDFPRRAYARIFNEYYRDQNVQSKVLETQEAILNCAWEKDYYTSALPWQQRGIAPSLPIMGTSSAVFSGAVDQWLPVYAGSADNNHNVRGSVADSSAGWSMSRAGTAGAVTNGALAAQVAASFKTWLNSNSVDLSAATTFDVADLRLVFQIQKFMERSARGGARYTEWLKSMFGVSPRDERLQRPEYIGGSKYPMIISEVLQTGSTDATSPQGNMAGHGLAVGQGLAAKYHAQEHGLIMGLLMIKPKTAYQQGIDRQWLRRSRWDFYNPLFANLSEQAVERAELYVSAVEAENRTIFGYQGRYNEMRSKNSQVNGLMRSSPFDTWHMGRVFSSAPGLNEAFIKCVPTKRIFATTSEPGLVVSFGNRIKAIRPMPYMSEPGLIDHG